MVVKLIERLSLGAFIGCFIVMFIMVLMSFQYGPQNIQFSGIDVINAFFGSIVSGWAFSLSCFIYDREDIAFPLQVIFQMAVGMGVLFAIAVYLKWMPIDLGIGPIITWIIIACIFGAVSWVGFYIYYYLVARDLNNKLNN
ncbi:DUF3021 domain-containing protein [Methanobrevibacter sp.]|uniref:DUF3021 domain-containing protein n=1 Tax=Methanobrevibacter sp. TaxID=66852 RepID=UPI003D7E9DA0